jgi:hypothetical protein
MLNRDQIKAGALRYKTKTAEVHCPGLADPDSGDDVVLVRGLSQTEFDAHQAATRIIANGEQIGIDESNISARIAVRVIVDADGNRLLPNDGDATWLGEASPKDVTEVVNKALELAGMAANGEPTDETVGNSAATQDGETSSGSPETTEEQPPPSSSDDSTLAAV